MEKVLIIGITILNISTVVFSCVSIGTYSTNITRDNDTITLSCCNNTLIQVTDVLYDPIDPILCKNNVGICDINCTLANFSNIVKGQCNNQDNCSLSVSSITFSNYTCNLTSIYLFVNYTCFAPIAIYGKCGGKYL